MPFVSITRLRLRSAFFLPLFAVYAVRSLRQVRRSPGFLAGRLLPDQQRTFWTLTLWNDEQSMRRYMTSGAHKSAMPRLMHWCDEASIVHFTSDDDLPPSWETADARMRAEGRPSKVNYPSPDHATLTYRPPRTTGSVAI